MAGLWCPKAVPCEKFTTHRKNLAHGLSVAQEGLLAEPRDAGEHVTAGWLVCAAGARERQWKVFKAALKVLTCREGGCHHFSLVLELPLLRAEMQLLSVLWGVLSSCVE